MGLIREATLMSETMLVGPAGALRAVVEGPNPGRGDAAARTPVLFAHSFAGSSVQWGSQLDHVGAARRAVALDFRGHGRSEALPGSLYDVRSFAADIGAVAD